jgi:Cytochrome P460
LDWDAKSGDLETTIKLTLALRAISIGDSSMLKYSKPLVFGLTLLFFGFALPQTSTTKVPQYANDGQMKLPEDYRQWIYLSTGFDMSYNPALQMDHHMFDNVFVNPEAYKAFVATGKWPDKTVFVLEARAGMDKGSINQRGNYQSSEIMGLEVHVKDESRFPGKWAFFRFGNAKTGTLIPTSADCYSCHSTHGAVDSTFVQFYPTLLPVAKSKGTLNSGYKP